MGRAFAGWPPEAVDVLLQLEGDPSLSERERLRRDHNRYVRAPMAALLDRLATDDERFDDYWLSGQGRATLWGWQRAFGVVRRAPGVELSVAYDLDGLQVRGTCWYGPAPERDAYRAAVAADGPGRDLVGVLDGLRSQGYTLDTSMSMKRVPRGYPADHPRADLLRLRSVSLQRWLGDEVARSASARHDVAEGFGELEPLVAWSVAHVAPTG